jgi:uncharacterized protein (TIGR00251 family)
VPSDEARVLRFAVKVHPGSKLTEVGGRHGDLEPPVLVARVKAQAVDGRANRALLDAIASAFAVGRTEVRIVSGESSRQKVLEVVGADPSVLEALLRQA